jgi:sensor c-di-GMP phosphodiesterase-like protein
VEQARQRSLEQEKFSLWYQPIVDRIATMVGLEALLRWAQQFGQEIAPSTFVPVAESPVAHIPKVAPYRALSPPAI